MSTRAARAVSTRASREKLLRLLGDRCADCGLRYTGGDLSRFHVDHPDGRDYEVSKIGSHNRVRRYWKEWLSGIRLRALCDDCNGWHGRLGLERSEARRKEYRETEHRG